MRISRQEIRQMRPVKGTYIAREFLKDGEWRIFRCEDVRPCSKGAVLVLEPVIGEPLYKTRTEAMKRADELNRKREGRS